MRKEHGVVAGRRERAVDSIGEAGRGERAAELEGKVSELEDLVDRQRKDYTPCQSRMCERTCSGSASGG